jgi:hypothetical protein
MPLIFPGIPVFSSQITFVSLSLVKSNIFKIYQKCPEKFRFSANASIYLPDIPELMKI